MKLLLISLLLTVAAELPADPVQRYTRFEAPFAPSLHIDLPAGGQAISSDWVAFELYPLLTAQDRWFVAREIEFINRERGLPMVNDIMLVPDGIQIIVPVYQRSDRAFAGDIRNWHVAVMKGRKYGVGPALMMAVRSHENPKKSRDRYAYGVVSKRHTDLWTQAEWAARIIARISAAQGWSALSPTQTNLYSLGAAYCVGVSPSKLSANGRDRTRRWSRNVWELYQRATSRGN